jgi:hypothetical protein
VFEETKIMLERRSASGTIRQLCVKGASSHCRAATQPIINRSGINEGSTNDTKLPLLTRHPSIAIV